MSKRTLLYPMPLLGQGTSESQSLRSYLEHLALAHHMKPRALLATLLDEYPIDDYSGALVSLVSRTSVIHGGSVLGRELKARLELATGVSLDGSTVAAFADLLAANGLTRSQRRPLYCPCCVREGEDLPYGRLLWELQCVTACPVHGVKLREASGCGAPAAERLPMNKRPSVRGVCTQCGSVGFKCISNEPETATAGELWVAQQAARLLALPASAVASFSKDSLRAGLEELVKGAYGGSVVQASREAGLARASVCTWVKGATPALPWLLQLCFNAGADVVALLGGTFRRLTNDASGRSSIEVISRSYNRAALTDFEIRNLLRQAASASEPPTLRQFALQNGLHPDAPRQRFAEEAAALVRARTAYEDGAKKRRFTEAVRAYTDAAASLQRRGKAVHAGSLQSESGLAAFSQNQPRVLALRAALAQARGSTSIQREGAC